MTTDWMRALAQQYERACRQHPDKPLMLLTDIDGTILDMRHMIRGVLQAYDLVHGTDYFERLTLEAITVHENQVEDLLRALPIPEDRWEDILAWYHEHRWDPEMLLETHRPFRGVLDIVRWFQLQPNTFVGLVTGRPERLREETLRSLNEIGRPYRVSFKSEFLYMNPGDWEENVPQVKVAGLQHFRSAGYHVFAFIDNEPENLKAVAAADPEHEVLLLHAATIFESKRSRLPRGAVRGKEYRLSELIRDERGLPPHIQLVWHGVNDLPNLRQFLASDVRWAEMDVMLDPYCREVILRHDTFAHTPLSPDEEWLTLPEVLRKLKEHGRAAKLDLKAGGELLDRVEEILRRVGMEDRDLWFNANIERLTEAGFRRLARDHPGAILQCPIDFLVPLILATPEEAHQLLEMFRAWGINRFSLSWKNPQLREVFDVLCHWGYEINIYNVPDLESFLEAALLLPRSLTSDFNFPQWHYYGHGSGESGEYHAYEERRPRGRNRRGASRESA